MKIHFLKSTFWHLKHDSWKFFDLAAWNSLFQGNVRTKFTNHLGLVRVCSFQGATRFFFSLHDEIMHLEFNIGGWKNRNDARTQKASNIQYNFKITHKHRHTPHRDFFWYCLCAKKIPPYTMIAKKKDLFLPCYFSPKSISGNATSCSASQCCDIQRDLESVCCWKGQKVFEVMAGQSFSNMASQLTPTP